MNDFIGCKYQALTYKFSHFSHSYHESNGSYAIGSIAFVLMYLIVYYMLCVIANIVSALWEKWILCLFANVRYVFQCSGFWYGTIQRTVRLIR